MSFTVKNLFGLGISKDIVIARIESMHQVRVFDSWTESQAGDWRDWSGSARDGGRLVSFSRKAAIAIYSPGRAGTHVAD